MAGIRIIGTGSFPGDKIVTNSDMEKIVDTSDQWIVSKTGIRSRYFADKLTNADIDVYKRQYKNQSRQL